MPVTGPRNFERGRREGVEPVDATTLAQPLTTDAMVTPEQALDMFDAQRAWPFAVGLAAVCLLAVPLIWFVGGDPLARWVHTIGLVGLFGVMVWYVVTTRDPRSYRPWKLLLTARVSAFTNATGYFYWGVFSAYAMTVSAAAYAFTSGGGRRTTRGVLAISILAHATLGGLQIIGVLEDRGLVSLPGIPRGHQIAVLVVLQLVLAGAVLAGHQSYDALRRVLEAYQAGQRAIAQREAQLAEAHAEVREAHALGVGRHSGERLGRFTLGAVLGRGAMGEVYAATDDRGSACAVKVLAGHLTGHDDALRRFEREARAISGLSAPNVIRILEIAPPDAKVPYFVMERLEGRDLGALLKERPTLELAEVLELVRAVAAGLEAAHEAGVIHRDLKPANVFAAVTPGGVVWKLLDFGVAKLISPDATMTVGSVVGTPGYMSPEQARGAVVDRRTDVYALGVLVYRLLTGYPVVTPGELPAMLHDIVYSMPPAPTQLSPVPGAVEAVLAIALAKDPDHRFASAGELSAAIAEAAEGVASAALAARAAAALAQHPWGQLRRPTRMRTVGA